MLLLLKKYAVTKILTIKTLYWKHIDPWFPYTDTAHNYYIRALLATDTAHNYYIRAPLATDTAHNYYIRAPLAIGCAG